MLAGQFEPFQIVFGPTRLGFYDRLQRFYRKRIPSPVRRHGHAPAIRVPVALMRTFLSYEIKTVPNKCGSQFSGG